MSQLVWAVGRSYKRQDSEIGQVCDALSEFGISCQVQHWNDEIPASADAVLVQGCGGYHQDTVTFRQWLAELEARPVTVINPVEVVRWNMDKTYLLDLQRAGISIVPTLWGRKATPFILKDVMEVEGLEEVVIKPSISAGADLTYRVPFEKADDFQEQVDAILAHSDLMVQPFLDSILSEGEWSFLFFGGQFSHAVVKTAKEGDYRIQHEHGGVYKKAEPSSALLSAVQQVVDALPGHPLPYARVDGVRLGDQLQVMEVELIEPYLYLDAHPESVRLFAKALSDVMKGEAVHGRVYTA